MVTNRQQYREKVSQMISWGHWFALFNILLSLGLGSRYLFIADWPASLAGRIYALVSWLGHFSFIVFAACFFWRTTFSPDMDFRWVALPQFAQGIAVACFMMPLTTMALAGIHPDRMADASSLSNFLRTLAASIGTSVTTTLWEQREALHHSRLSEFISIYNPISNGAFARLESMGLSDTQSAHVLAGEITRQGFIIAADEIFWLGGILFLFMCALVWLAKKPRHSHTHTPHVVE